MKRFMLFCNINPSIYKHIACFSNWALLLFRWVKLRFGGRSKFIITDKDASKYLLAYLPWSFSMEHVNLWNPSWPWPLCPDSLLFIKSSMCWGSSPSGPHWHSPSPETAPFRRTLYVVCTQLSRFWFFIFHENLFIGCYRQQKFCWLCKMRLRSANLTWLENTSTIHWDENLIYCY